MPDEVNVLQFAHLCEFSGMLIAIAALWTSMFFPVLFESEFMLVTFV
jgi:hypothetical protein